MPRLDQRLKTVARMIRATVHADVGSDHGHLLKALLAAGRISHGIAIENKRTPFANSTATLSGLNAEVIFADGLAGLANRPSDAATADSLSICGMGGRSIAEILGKFPACVPDTVITQPNKDADLVRRWALTASFEIVDEAITDGSRHFTAIRFRRTAGDSRRVYAGIDMAAGLIFGPLLVRRRDPVLLKSIQQEIGHLSRLPTLETAAKSRLAAAEWVREHLDSDFS